MRRDEARSRRWAASDMRAPWTVGARTVSAANAVCKPCARSPATFAHRARLAMVCRRPHGSVVFAAATLCDTPHRIDRIRQQETWDENHRARGALHPAAGRAEPSARRASRQRPRKAPRLRCRRRVAQPRRHASRRHGRRRHRRAGALAQSARLSGTRRATRRSRWRGRSTICCSKPSRRIPIDSPASPPCRRRTLRLR